MIEPQDGQDELGGLKLTGLNLAGLGRPTVPFAQIATGVSAAKLWQPPNLASLSLVRMQGLTDVGTLVRGIAEGNAARLVRASQPLAGLAFPDLNKMFASWNFGFLDQFRFPEVVSPLLVTHRAFEGLQPAIKHLQGLALGQLFQWGDLFRTGFGLARDFARFALNAALRARRAVVGGCTEDLDEFIERWLKQKPTSWRRDAVAVVLLRDDWVPDDPAAGGWGVIKDIRDLVRDETRNHKLLGETQLNGRPLTSLDRAVLLDGGASVPLVATVADPRASAALAVGGGYEDTRLVWLADKLKPEERVIFDAYGDGAGTWGEAALMVGRPPEAGESVRRKCLRLRTQYQQRRESALLVRPSQERG